jgi:hypothetical protein
MNGNSMAAQRKAVEDYFNDGNWREEFVEVESGKKADRPEYSGPGWRVSGERFRQPRPSPNIRRG